MDEQFRDWYLNSYQPYDTPEENAEVAWQESRRQALEEAAGIAEEICNKNHPGDIQPYECDACEIIEKIRAISPSP